MNQINLSGQHELKATLRGAKGGYKDARRIEGATRSNSESECIIWDSIVDTVKNRATLRDAPHIYFTSVWGTDRTHMKKTMKNKHFWVAWYMGPGCTLQRSAWANDWATKMQPKVMPPEMSCQEGSVPRHQAETAGCWVPWDHTPSNCTQAAIPGSAKSSGLWANFGPWWLFDSLWMLPCGKVGNWMELNGVDCQNFNSLVSQHVASEATKKLIEPFLPSGPPVTLPGTTGFWALRLAQGEIFFNYEIFRHGGKGRLRHKTVRSLWGLSFPSRASRLSCLQLWSCPLLSILSKKQAAHKIGLDLNLKVKKLTPFQMKAKDAAAILCSLFRLFVEASRKEHIIPFSDMCVLFLPFALWCSELWTPSTLNYELQTLLALAGEFESVSWSKNTPYHTSRAQGHVARQPAIL